jgi:hypothetical protein
MHSLIAIVARCILLSTYLEDIGASAGVIEANNLPADATFRESNSAAADLPQAGQNWHTDEDELLAELVSARISEPEQVTGVLNELRVESTGHLGRLDLEEWSEMMTEMRKGGVALGDRNKLRLLVDAQSSRSHSGGAAPFDGHRRAQTGSADEASGSRAGRPGDSTSTAKAASEQESSSEPTSTIFGVSGDSTF